MLHYEDLPDGDKGIISKAIEEFQNKCLLSYTKTRDNIIVQKFPLPRVLLHGQKDTTEAEDRRFFKEVVDKSVRDAISSHNESFGDIFHNAMRETIHGFLVGQGGPTYYNILDPLTQWTNQVRTSHQEAAPVGSGDIQTVQGSSGHIPWSAQKIAPSIQRIRRDIDPYVYNQRLQAASQQRTQQIEIPQGYHYGTYYNTLHMMPNPGYQGT